MIEIELEKTYLVKNPPSDLEKYPKVELIDIYLPKSSPHPDLRIRRKGEKYEITKKSPVKDNDASAQTEHTIKLTKEEYQTLEKIDGLKIRKFRYSYPYGGQTGEIDVFQDNLSGLILADFEFKTEKERDEFPLPSFCLADVTNDPVIAGGILASKKFSDLTYLFDKYR